MDPFQMTEEELRAFQRVIQREVREMRKETRIRENLQEMEERREQGQRKAILVREMQKRFGVYLRIGSPMTREEYELRKEAEEETDRELARWCIGRKSQIRPKDYRCPVHHGNLRSRFEGMSLDE